MHATYPAGPPHKNTNFLTYQQFYIPPVLTHQCQLQWWAYFSGRSTGNGTNWESSHQRLDSKIQREIKIIIKWNCKIQMQCFMDLQQNRVQNPVHVYIIPTPTSKWSMDGPLLPLGKNKLLYWSNGLLKNRVGRAVLFFYSAVCPFIHFLYPVYS